MGRPCLVILLGPPASGKGTQAKELHARFGWKTFSTGAAIRSHVERGTPFGERCRAMLGSAYLLPDAMILELVRAELADHQGGLVLDGFPRTLEQARLFDDYCQERHWQIDAVIAIEATESELAARVVSRLTCPKCGGTYRAGDQGLALGMPCPACQKPLARRKDDTPEVFAERFAEYERLTHPLVDFYASRGILHRFNALTPSPELADHIESLFQTIP